MAATGVALSAVGLLVGMPTLIAVGLLLCWGGAFLTLIGFLQLPA
mgnify:CR=1 FL=1|tara:strand:+ start:69 stop:203 length:135 start_codon:yes stop_codon:yes gene_type:complete